MSDLDLELKSRSGGLGVDEGFSLLEFYPTKSFEIDHYFDFGEEINPSLGSLKNSSSVKRPNFLQQ